MRIASTRRTFLTSAAAIVALPALGHAEDSHPSFGEFHLGVASYSFRKFSREQAIQMTKDLGATWINIKSFHLTLDSTPDQIKAARAEFENAGLHIEGGGNISFEKDDEADMRHKFEYAKLAGMPIIVCAPTHTTLPKLEPFVKEYNIKIAVHNHGPEDKNFPTPQSVLAVLREHNLDPRMGCCIDIGHTARTGVDVVGAIRDAGPRLLSMHIKDLRSFTERDSQCDVGEGKIPIPEIFKQLKSMNYAGGVMLEYEIHDTDPMPGMQKSFSYMRGVRAGLAAA